MHAAIQCAAKYGCCAATRRPERNIERKESCMKRRLSLGLGLPAMAGVVALGIAMHSGSTHGYAASSTPPPPPSTVPTPITPPPPPPTFTPTPAPPTATATTAAPTATAPAATTPTPTPKPAAKPTATTAAPTPPPSTGPPPTAAVVPTIGSTKKLHQGFGGTASHGVSGAPQGANSAKGSPAQLPRTGGA